jgi:hypothetical protein
MVYAAEPDGPPAPTLAEAILRALLYADIFHYPLTVEEIHRYLVAYEATLAEVAQALAEDKTLRARVAWQGAYAMLAGQGEHAALRESRAEANQQLWAAARRYAVALAALPFVRMVAVTGSLAVYNSRDAADDIDYLIVTAPGRLWLARFFAVMLTHVGHLRRVALCPNYLITLDALEQPDRSLFTAHELAQMVPLYGLDVYTRLMEANAWARAYLPNAFPAPPAVALVVLPEWVRACKAAIEGLLQGALGEHWEAWERARKIRRLRDRAGRAGTLAAQFNEHRCKGHMEDYGRRVAEAYAARLRTAGLKMGEG